MVVGKVVREYEGRGTQVASTVVGARIAKLVKEGRLVGFGDFSNWRFSEIRLPLTPKRSDHGPRRGAPPGSPGRLNVNFTSEFAARWILGTSPRMTFVGASRDPPPRLRMDRAGGDRLKYLANILAKNAVCRPVA